MMQMKHVALQQVQRHAAEAMCFTRNRVMIRQDYNARRRIQFSQAQRMEPGASDKWWKVAYQIMFLLFSCGFCPNHETHSFVEHVYLMCL